MPDSNVIQPESRIVYYYKNGRYYAGTLTERNVADPYDPAKSYAPGDMADYLGVLFLCKESATGAFDPTKWDEVKLANVVSGKQDELVSGTNIKTINSQSLLGSGDIVIQAGVTSVNTRTGDVTLSKSDVGLSNVDNKSEATIKSDFTGSIASGNTGFVTGGTVYGHTSDTSNPHVVTKAQVGLGNVDNTSDSATPASGGTQKFTTGGAYALKAELTGAIGDINDVLFAGSIDTDDYELADFIKWVHLQENPIDGAIYTMYDRNHEFCVWKGMSLDEGRTVVALMTTMTSGGGEGTPILHLVSVINIDETTGECTFEDAEMASKAALNSVDTKASKVVIGGTQYTASFSGGVLSFNS